MNARGGDSHPAAPRKWATDYSSAQLTEEERKLLVAKDIARQTEISQDIEKKLEEGLNGSPKDLMYLIGARIDNAFKEHNIAIPRNAKPVFDELVGSIVECAKVETSERTMRKSAQMEHVILNDVALNIQKVIGAMSSKKEEESRKLAPVVKALKDAYWPVYYRSRNKRDLASLSFVDRCVHYASLEPSDHNTRLNLMRGFMRAAQEVVREKTEWAGDRLQECLKRRPRLSMIVQGAYKELAIAGVAAFVFAASLVTGQAKPLNDIDSQGLVAKEVGYVAKTGQETFRTSIPFIKKTIQILSIQGTPDREGNQTHHEIYIESDEPLFPEPQEKGADKPSDSEAVVTLVEPEATKEEKAVHVTEHTESDSLSVETQTHEYSHYSDAAPEEIAPSASQTEPAALLDIWLNSLRDEGIYAGLSRDMKKELNATAQHNGEEAKVLSLIKEISFRAMNGKHGKLGADMRAKGAALALNAAEYIERSGILYRDVSEQTKRTARQILGDARYIKERPHRYGLNPSQRTGYTKRLNNVKEFVL